MTYEKEQSKRNDYFRSIDKDSKIIVTVIEVKDSYFYMNNLGEEEFLKSIVNIKSILEGIFKEKCFVYREKKILLIKEINPKTKIKKQIRQIKRKFKKIKIIESKYLEFGCYEFTLGMAFGKKINIIKNANIAIGYAKKNNVKNVVYSIGLLKKIKKERYEKEQEEKIKEAILKGKIIPFYQKIIDNKTLEVLKYEALARIINNGKIIFPGVFMPAIKKFNLEEKFARDMIKNVFEDVYIRNIVENASLNININDIKNKNTNDRIMELLEVFGGKRITFEITETIGIDNYSILTEFAKTIKEKGSKISIDDFGSGHSGYEHLMNIDVDYLKLDGKFIEKIKKNEKIKSLIKGLCDFSKIHNIKIIAEFVEDKETYEILKELGVDYSQGYYFGKPMDLR